MVVDFTASWCGPCRFIAPFFADLAKKLPNVLFLKVDTDELKVHIHQNFPFFMRENVFFDHNTFYVFVGTVGGK